MSRSRRFIASFIGAVVIGVGVVVVTPPAPAVAAAAPVTVDSPGFVRATGALLTWGRTALPAGGTFVSYEVHRSSASGFTPATSTRIATYTDAGRTLHQDSSAAPGKTWFYRVRTTVSENGVVTTADSPQVSATTPAAGSATATLQPGGSAGQVATVATDLSAPTACSADANYGKSTTVNVGSTSAGDIYRGLVRFDLRRIPAGATVTAATLTMTAPPVTTAYTSGAVTVQRLTRPFVEGTESGTCTSSGASWAEAANGIRWSKPGGDSYAGTLIGPGVSIAAKARSTTAATVDTANVLGIVKEWVAGTAPNDGFLMRATTEPTAVPATSTHVTYASDDNATASYRPKLQVTFSDPTTLVPTSRVILGTPGADAAVRGSATLTASATDDSRVASMDFLIDGVIVGSDSTAPFAWTWNSTTATRGSHTFSARATDDAGLVTSGPTRTFSVDNQAAPAGSLGPVPATYSGAQTLSATATDDVGVDRIEFTVDDTVVGVGGGSGATRTLAWDSEHPLLGVADGNHTVAAYAVDVAGQRTLLGSAPTTVANRGTSQYSATLSMGDPQSAADDGWPGLVTDNLDPSLDATPVNLYNGTTDASGLWSPDAGSTSTSGTLSSAPKDSTSGMTSPTKGTSIDGTPSSPLPASGAEQTDTSTTSNWSYAEPPAVDCPEDAFCPVVTVQNTSNSTWKGDAIRVWYRWYAPNGAVAFEGPASDTFVNSFPKNKLKSFRLVIYPPALPTGVELGQYQLRIDLYDTANGTWFASQGNKALDNPVIVAKHLSKNLGFEKFWTYNGGQTGAGSLTATNVANGNLLWRWSPWTSPGRGLATVMDLTYNSLEDHSRSPVGESFSLSISGLSRLGEPIEIHPNKADQISNKAKKYVEFVDGDGTVHRFDGQVDGTWKRPPGVHLYLRSVTSDTADPRYWAISRPDGVTFFYDNEGFPTFVRDRNGNEITYVLEDTPAGEDPGGPKKRVKAVRDAGGRDYTITYLSKGEEKNGRVRGNIKRISDHSGSAMDFQYYADGNLRKVIQRGGVGDDGAYLDDRQFVFTYTTSKGDAPAISAADDRKDPAERTPNQSTKLFSVIDPKQAETTFEYYGATDNPKLRWFVKSRTDRATTAGAAKTTFGYDLAAKVSTVTDGLGKATTYAYDSLGRATRITNAKNESTTYRWTADNHVDQITEPNNALQTFTYDDRGYLTQRVDQVSATSRMAYTQQKILATDTVPWMELLQTATDPMNAVTSFTYDGPGNVRTQTDPENGVTTYAWNQPGTANAGTLAQVDGPRTDVADVTKMLSYDANGLVTKVQDAAGGITQMGYSDDGLLRWTQTPTHASPPAGMDPRGYRTYVDYDAFHREVRTSTPKSTTLEPGMLVWSGSGYDANNNITVQRSASYGVGEPGNAPFGTIDFDAMDRPTRIVGPDKADGDEVNIKTYDLIGRLVSETAPKGVDTPSVAGDYTTTYAYDLVDRVIMQTRQGASGESARKSWLCYDNVGNRVASYQPKANLAAAPTTCPTGATPWALVTQYDLAHRVTRSIDSSNRSSTQVYDGNGRVKTATDEAGSTRTITYDKRGLTTGQVTQLTATRSLTAKMEYDAAGNLVKEISPRAVDAGTSTDFVTTHAYDALNREITKGLPKDASTSAAFEHMVYDGDGRMTEKTLPIAAATLPADLSPNATTETRYYDTGWIAGSRQAGVPEVLFDYTPQGWQAERVPRESTAPGAARNESLTMLWTYFDDGQIRSRMDENGLPITMAYDQHNLLTKGTVTSGIVTPDAVPTQTTASYNGFDQVVRAGETALVDDATKRTENYTTYSYDTHGVLISRGDLGKSGATTQAVKRNEFVYDSLDRLVTQWELGTATTCTDDRRITTTWSGQDWLSSRTIAKAAAACTAEKSATASDWTTTQVEAKTYLKDGSLDTSTTENGAGVVQESHTLSYDQNGAWTGQRTQDVFQRQTPTAGKACMTTTCTATWTFNARDQLTRYANGAGDVTTYTLDEPGQQADSLVRAGNVTKEVAPNGTVSTRKYVGNQMTESSTTVSGVTNTTKTIYDDLGRTDCIVKAAGSAADCKTTGTVSANLITDYAYDYLDRLEAVRTYSGGTLQDETKYVSDALDRVVQQTEMHKGSGTENRTVSFAFLGLTEQIASETSSSTGSRTDTTVSKDSSTKAYSYDAFGQRFRMTDSSSTTKTDGTSSTSTTTATYATDPHSSVTMLLNDSGTNEGKVKAAYGYTAYGDQDDKLSAGDTDKKKPFNPFRYTGQRLDSGSGTLQAGARRYDPGATRFLQQDIFKNAVADMGLTMDPLSQNRYGLAAGNPTSNIEFDGHRIIANGGGGGSVPTQPNEPSSDALKTAGTTSAEYEKAKSVDKDFDIGKKLVEVGLDFVGVNDIKDCISNPSIGSCAMAVANFIPWGKIFKAGKLGKRLFEVAGEFLEWRKAREAADALLSKVDDAAKKADGAATKADNPGTSCKLANSFTGETRVVMADGSRKPIRDVRAGDRVKAKDPTTGKVTARKVTGTIHTKGDKALVVLRLADGGQVIATSGHPVWEAATKRWVEAGQLKTGDETVTESGRWTAVATTRGEVRSTDVYNLSVDVDHTYLVDTGVGTALVHNCGSGKDARDAGTGADETAAKADGAGSQSSARVSTTKSGTSAANGAADVGAATNKIYSARVLQRMGDEPGPMHNFPGSFDDAVFESGTRSVSPNYFNKAKPNLSNDSIQYRLPGEINGKSGTFEIFTRPSTSGRSELIMHRFFRPDY